MLPGMLDPQTLPDTHVHTCVCLCMLHVGCAVPTVSDECLRALSAAVEPDGESEWP